MNGIVIVDKPSDWTSQDVCAKLRGIFGEKRIGHSGTLDPMATGVLTVFIGRATRAVEFAESDSKRYIAGFRPGVVTDTQDTTGNVLETNEAHITKDDLLAVLPEFSGQQEQIPPMYSAIKIGGRKLYELARRGEIVDRKARKITIHDIKLLRQNDCGDFILDISCSKGTYIRTLCADIGARLGCGGCMSSLRRIEAGVFTVDDAVTIDELISAKAAGTLSEHVIPVDRLFSSLPEVVVSDEAVRMCKNGQVFPCAVSDGKYRVYAPNGEFLMLGECLGENMKTIKSFFEVK